MRNKRLRLYMYYIPLGQWNRFNLCIKYSMCTCVSTEQSSGGRVTVNGLCPFGDCASVRLGHDGSMCVWCVTEQVSTTPLHSTSTANTIQRHFTSRPRTCANLHHSFCQPSPCTRYVLSPFAPVTPHLPTRHRSDKRSAMSLLPLRSRRDRDRDRDRSERTTFAAPFEAQNAWVDSSLCRCGRRTRLHTNRTPTVNIDFLTACA